MYRIYDSIVITTENTIAVKKLFTLNPGTNLEAIITIKASITKVNKPKVKTVTGKDSINRIGFIKIFRAARTKATIKATLKEETDTPERRYAVA